MTCLNTSCDMHLLYSGNLASGVYSCQCNVIIIRLLFHPEKLSPCTGAFVFLRGERPYTKKKH